MNEVNSESTDLILYLDESGNDWSNWIDSKSPFFVYGGWIIDRSFVSNTTKFIQQIDSLSPNKEVKSAFLRNHREALYSFIQSFINDVHAIPVVVIADKRYMVAAKITELLFDNSYNNSLNNSITYNAELKKALAGIIYKDNSIISLFGNEYSKKAFNKEVLVDIRKKAISLFETEGLFCVSASIKTITSNGIDAMTNELNDDNDRCFCTLMFPVMTQLLININNLGSLNYKKITIVADEYTDCEKVFNRVKQLSNPLYNNIDGIFMGKSKEEGLLRAADWYVGFVTRCFSQTDNWSNDSQCQIIWRNHINMDGLLNQNGVRLIDYDGCESIMLETISKLTGINKKFDNKYHETIMKMFPLVLNDN